MLSLLSSLEEGGEDDEDEDKSSVQTFCVRHGSFPDFLYVCDVPMAFELAGSLCKMMFQYSQPLKAVKVEFWCSKHILRNSIFMEPKLLKEAAKLLVQVGKEDDGEFLLTFAEVFSQLENEKLHSWRFTSEWRQFKDDEDGASFKGEHSDVPFVVLFLLNFREEMDEFSLDRMNNHAQMVNTSSMEKEGTLSCSSMGDEYSLVVNSLSASLNEMVSPFNGISMVRSEGEYKIGQGQSVQAFQADSMEALTPSLSSMFVSTLKVSSCMNMVNPLELGRDILDGKGEMVKKRKYTQMMKQNFYGFYRERVSKEKGGINVELISFLNNAWCKGALVLNKMDSVIQGLHDIFHESYKMRMKLDGDAFSEHGESFSCLRFEGGNTGPLHGGRSSKDRDINQGPGDNDLQGITRFSGPKVGQRPADYPLRSMHGFTVIAPWIKMFTKVSNEDILEVDPASFWTGDLGVKCNLLCSHVSHQQQSISFVFCLADGKLNEGVHMPQAMTSTTFLQSTNIACSFSVMADKGGLRQCTHVTHSPRSSSLVDGLKFERKGREKLKVLAWTWICMACSMQGYGKMNAKGFAHVSHVHHVQDEDICILFLHVMYFVKGLCSLVLIIPNPQPNVAPLLLFMYFVFLF